MSCGSFDPAEPLQERIAREEACTVAIEELRKMEIHFASAIKKQKTAVERSWIVSPPHR